MDGGGVNQFVRLLFLYLPDDGDLVVVANGVFTQEIELHHTLVAFQLLMQGDVLNT